MRSVLAQSAGVAVATALVASAGAPLDVALRLAAACAVVFLATVATVAALIPLTREGYGLLVCVRAAPVPASTARAAAHASTWLRPAGSPDASKTRT